MSAAHTVYTAEIADTVLSELTAGRSLRDICAVTRACRPKERCGCG
jgi:hypothetical protein